MDIDIPTETCLIEIVTDSNTINNHCIYCLDKNGNIITHTKIQETLNNIINNINHMYIIQFTTKQMYEMQCKTMYNRIFEPDIIPYDNIQSWAMTPLLIQIIRHYINIQTVQNYEQSNEYLEGKKIVNLYIHSYPIPIERINEDIHQQGIQSRTKQLHIIKEWINI